MKDKTLVGGIIVMVVGAILIGIVWLIFLQPAQTPTTPITALPVELERNHEQFTIFEIVKDESEVSFEIDETLRGLPTTAVGIGHELAGQIAVNFENPAASKVGPILVNARTLLTDNEFRNNAIHSFILDSEPHEFIQFTPRRLTGLPDQFTPGEPVSFQIEGDLTIRQISQPVVFEAVVTANGRTQLTGLATAQIQRDDFNLQIPNAPGVANVSEIVKLSIHFVAVPHQ